MTVFQNWNDIDRVWFLVLGHLFKIFKEKEITPKQLNWPGSITPATSISIYHIAVVPLGTLHTSYILHTYAGVRFSYIEKKKQNLCFALDVLRTISASDRYLFR